VAPWTRNSMDNRVLPQPALPQIKVGRPFGKPPKVISSSPCIPVGVFGNEVGRVNRPFLPLADGFEKLACAFIIPAGYLDSSGRVGNRQRNLPFPAKNDLSQKSELLVNA
jgi:hypothetical protein